ncbi:MAG: GEVED domain-containing protein [Bacteroidota bacterium]
MSNSTLSLSFLCHLLFLILVLGSPPLMAQPNGFVDENYLSGFNQATGLTFDENGRMYVFEKGGKVWVVENGNKLPNPLIDIGEEVGNWRDFGLVGFALDPNFLNNGHIYLLYIVDRHHLLNFGTSSYNPSTNSYFAATIGRITRYTATASSNFTSVDYNSRRVLFGESVSTGMPSLHQSHGVGALVFGTDGTLLATLGDGASYSSVDEGSATETYYAQGLTDGIIRSDENVGAYRCQMPNSFNGKIIRIDPETGDGIPSNPFYNASNPRSPQSRTYAVGVRNPYRMCLRPETGSHQASEGDPGTFYFGDVGWGTREELNVLSAAGQNFGWPKYEGMTYQPGYDNPNYAPSSHERPKVDWRSSTARVWLNGNIYNIGSSNFPGSSFQGNASTGGVWYTGDDFPPEYQNTYFHADYGNGWIRNFSFDANNEPLAVRDFLSNIGAVVHMATSPAEDGIFYVSYPGSIRKISYVGNGNLAPKARISYDQNYGSSPLEVSFRGDQSYDPENGGLNFSWDFGDGTVNSTEANPTHIFTAAPGGPTTYTVTLTVSDNQSQSAQASVVVSINNTPPVINSTSIDNRNTFSINNSTTLSLNADVTDAEHANSELTYEWSTSLYHNNHNHLEPADNNPSTTTVLTPVGCDGATYWYRVSLTVTDPEGLSTTFSKDIFPNCSGSNQSISFGALADKQVGDAPFPVSASASSGLPVALYVVDGPASISGNTIRLTGKPGTVTVRAAQGGNGTYKPARPVERTFHVSQAPPSGGSCSATGQITREVWTGISGLLISDIPVNDPPNQGGLINIFEGPSNVADNYGSRIRGYICPPQTGDYTFWIASDDNGELWLSTDDDPANKVQIASVPGWTNSREWDKFSDQQSSPIRLQAGQRYYIEALQKEQRGGDNLAVGWQLPNNDLERPIPGSYLAPWDGGTPPSQRPAVSLSTESLTVDGPFTVIINFSETITGLSISDFNITNATASNLSGNGQSYRITVDPSSAGTVSIRLPGNRVEDVDGERNTASNTLNVGYNSTVTCENVTSGGSIDGDESQCDPYDPARIDNNSLPSGGSGTRQYRWQYSTSSATGPWTNIPSSNSASYDPPAITESTWYRRRARRENCSAYVGISNVVFKEVGSGCGGGTPPTGYCDARGTSPWVEWIQRVEFVSIDNTSAKDGYADYTAQQTNVSQGNIYPITLTPGLSWPGYQTDLHWRVWIDANRDGDFEDSGEQVLQERAISSPISANILIPASASPGLTRMRISAQRGAYADPCEVFSNGEVEDYLVNIEPGSGGSCFLFASSDNLSCDDNGTDVDPSDDTFTFELTVSGSNTGANWTADGQSGNYGTPTTFGPYPISGGNISLTITDSDDPDCQTNISVSPPAPCSNAGDPPTGYCDSRGRSPWQEWIQLVQFRSIDNSSAKDGYGDYTSIRTSVAKGAAYPIRLEPGLSWGGYQTHLYWRVWIDLNRDGDFNDANELVMEANAISQAIDETIGIPSSASNGPTRMRVSMQKDAYADPCEAFDRGEVEDYLLVIGNGGGGDITPPSATLGASGLIVNGAFDATLDFSESITGLTASDFDLTNGSISGVSGSGQSYVISITPTAEGNVSIRLPANKVIDGAGNGNTVSNLLEVFYDPPLVPRVGISSPTSGQSITGNSVTVSFTTANLTDEHLLLTLDNDFEIDIHDPPASGTHTFNNVPAGNHTLVAQLLDNNHDPLPNPEARASVNFRTQIDPPTGGNYCNSRGTEPWWQWISNVSFADIDNDSNKDLYGDFTAQTASVDRGGSYPISLQATFSYFHFEEYFRVWIDYNQDGDFEDAGEEVFSGILPEGTPGSSVDPVTGTIDIPATATLGTTRMRVSMQNGSYADPCESFQYGEVEDYSVDIGAGSGFSLQQDILLFDARLGKRLVELEWVSNAGNATDYFVIERSADGRRFDPYREVDHVGNGMGGMRYQQVDDTPFVGVNYYRLKQVFQNGSHRYSLVKKVEFDWDLNEIALFPNPTTERLFVHAQKLEGFPVLLQVYDQLGQLVLEEQVAEWPSSPHAVQLRKFHNGMYTIRIKAGERKQISRNFIVNRLY